MTNTTDLGVGDVALDLAQGRPVHVIGDPGLTVAAWNAQNNYDLLENYGNQRLETTEDDRVYDVVYCSSAKSEPSRSYTMPASRLLRVETEAADGGRPVRQRVQRETLVAVFTVLQRNGHDAEVDLLADELGDSRAPLSAAKLPSVQVDDDEEQFVAGIVGEARELANVDATIGGDDA